MRTLTQTKKTTKRIDRYPYERKMDADELMGRAINRLRFKSNIWEKGSGVGIMAVYQMVNDVRYLSGLEPMTQRMVYDGYQWCVIFHKNYKYAFEEFKHLCWGDW
jgi:hypothetical protein